MPFFSENAVDIESKMHPGARSEARHYGELRREFFYAKPTEARDLLEALRGELLQFE